ncbi:MAG: peptidoglycan/LPS O-acetylase OafA/YrhL [Oleiphilaceae bacterium]
MHYRKEIDGLRAIAILPVIWMHSGLPYITGGFLGVDVFFVISGFLITSILLRDFDSNNFSLVKFYERRARRILPALVTVIAVSSLIVPFISGHPKFIGDYGASVLSTVLFSSNIYFWQTSGYFGSASELSPMLHTWSLAVEEQYYIFFPLLMMVLFSPGKKIIVSALILISIFSLMISEWGAVNSPIGNFYLLPSRAWELMAGALAAVFYLNYYLVKIRTKFSTYLSGIGIVFILISYLLFTPSTLHPTSLTVLPVLGTVLVLLFTGQGNFVGKVLSTKLLSMIGLISYSLYLWHQPVLSFTKNIYSIHLEPNQIITAITLTFFLSYLTWKYVENPFRDRKKFSENKIFKYSLVSIALLSLCGLLFKENLQIQKLIFPEQIVRFEQLLQADNSHSNQVMFDNSDCKFWSKEFDNNFIDRFDNCAKKYDKAVFILGGSHGMDLYNAVASNASNPFIVSVSRGFCRAHKFFGDQKNLPKCQYVDFKLFADKYSNNISYVLYTQTPDRLFKVTPLDKASTKELSLERLKEVTNYLADIKEKNSLNVIMIGMLPPLNKQPISWNYKQPFDEQFNDIVSLNSINLTKFVDNAFASELKKHEIPYISKFEAFALDLPRDLIVEKSITYSDGRHISHKGEKVFGQRLINYMINQGYSQLNIAE